MVDYLHAALGCGGLILGAARVRQLRGDTTARSLWVAFCFLSTAQCLETPTAYRAVGSLLGLTGAASTTMGTLVVIGATATRVLAASLDGAPQTARSWRGFAGPAVIVVLTMWSALLLDQPAHVPSALQGRPTFYDESPWSATQWLTSLAYLTWALWAMLLALRRCVDDAPRSPLRSGLVLGAAGVGVGFLFVALKVTVVICWVTGRGPATVALDEYIEAAILSVCLLFLGIGSCWSSLHRRWRAYTTALRTWHAMRTLRFLEKRLRIAAPDNAPDLQVSGGHLSLVVQVMGIRDRQRHLRHYVRPDFSRAAHVAAISVGCTRERAHLVAEAARIEAGAGAKARGCAARTGDVARPLGGDGIWDEVRWLRKLTKTCRRDAAVGQVLAAMAERAPSVDTPEATAAQRGVA